MKPRTGIYTNCTICKKEFYICKSRIGLVRNCSRSCQNKAMRTNKPLVCLICSNEFYCSKSQQKLRNRKTCSRKCVGIYWKLKRSVKDPQRKQYYQEHKEEYRLRNIQWKQANKEKFKDWMREYRSQPSQLLLHRLRQSKRRAVMKGNGYDNSITPDSLNELICKQNFKCVTCKRDLFSSHIDHIIPVSKGGKHTISNVQLLCPSCNVRKSNKLNWKPAYEI